MFEYGHLIYGESGLIRRCLSKFWDFEISEDKSKKIHKVKESHAA